MNTQTEQTTNSRRQLIAARDVLLSEIDRSRPQLAQYLPDQSTVDRFIALARKAVIDNPDLCECSTVSVLKALGACAASGLQLDGKFSSLIVRRPKQGKPSAHWDPTYRGLTSLALESGHVIDAHSQVVRDGDEFSVELGTQPKLHHRPALDGKGKVIAAYAVATLRSGGIVHEVLTRADIDKIKAQSTAGERGPWGSWDDEMSKKSAMRRLLKRLPAGVVRSIAFDQLHDTPRLFTPAPNLQRPPSLPEDEHRLECDALERLSNAVTATEVDAAWAVIVNAYDGAGLEVPLKVEAKFHERRSAFAEQQG